MFALSFLGDSEKGYAGDGPDAFTGVDAARGLPTDYEPLFMRLVMFGPPAAGKGTQARLLAERTGLNHISTGELFRDEIDRGTELGKTARTYIAKGNLVPDDVVWSVARRALEVIDGDDFVLDGYPRTLPQARLLRDYLDAKGGSLDAVLHLRLAEEEIVRRISRRRIDTETGRTYHLDYQPPPEDVPADRLAQREDDRPEAVRKRLKVYEERTAHILRFYEGLDLVRRIDADGTIEEVYDRIEDVLSSLEASS